MAQSNFQDVVVLNQQTLSFQGEQLIIGTDAGSKQLVFANSAASLALAANPTANRTIALPDANGTVGLITAISAGTTFASSGSIVFTNSNNVSFGLNINTITATASAPGGGAGVTAIGVSTGGNTAGNTGTTQGTYVLAGAGIVTLSQSTDANGGTVTISATQSTAPAMISAGTQNATSGTLSFIDSNGISWGMSGSSQITATADYVRSISAGTTNATGNQIVFSNSNGIVFGANGATVTAAEVNFSFWENRHDLQGSNTAFFFSTAAGTGNISFQRLTFANPIAATRLDFIAGYTVSNSSAGSYTLQAALYTMNHSTLSTVSTGSVQITFTSGTTASSSQFGGHSGIRYRSIPLGTWNITPGEYMLALMISNSGPSATWTIYGGSSLLVSAIGTGNYSNYFADGVFSAGTNAFPASVHLSAIIQTSTALAQPYIRLIGTF